MSQILILGGGTDRRERDKKGSGKHGNRKRKGKGKRGDGRKVRREDRIAGKESRGGREIKNREEGREEMGGEERRKGVEERERKGKKGKKREGEERGREERKGRKTPSFTGFSTSTFCDGTAYHRRDTNECGCTLHIFSYPTVSKLSIFKRLDGEVVITIAAVQK